jgi:hypothetical protein
VVGVVFFWWGWWGLGGGLVGFCWGKMGNGGGMVGLDGVGLEWLEEDG